MGVASIVLLALLGTGVSLDTFNHDLVKPRMYFEATYYPSPYATPRFIDAPTDPENYLKSYIRVQTEYTVLKILDLQVGMRGFATSHGFGGTVSGNGGFGGGIWGATLRVTDNFALQYEHFSCHVFNVAQRCGGYDGLTMRFSIGYEDSTRESLLGRLIKWK